MALQYGSAQGRPELREQICEVMAAEGIRADPDDVVVTVGSQMALDLVTRTYCDPGDVVLTEGPAYVGALGSFAAYQARVVHVAMDAERLVLARLRAALATLAARGTTPKFLYTVPTTVARGTSPTAASTCGSPCPRAWTRRRCCRAP